MMSVARKLVMATSAESCASACVHLQAERRLVGGFNPGQMGKSREVACCFGRPGQAHSMLEGSSKLQTMNLEDVTLSVDSCLRQNNMQAHLQSRCFHYDA